MENSALRDSEIDGKIKHATFSQTTTGNWFVAIVAEIEIPDAKPPVVEDNFVGIDFGIKTFITVSDGESVDRPKFYQKSHRRLAKAQRQMSRCKTGSNRRKKAQLEVAKTHERIANQRKDFIHKTTTKIVLQHSGVAIEDLCIASMAKTKLAKSVMDASLGETRRQFTYKCQWNLKPCVVVDRWFPSSKKCSACGKLNQLLKLSDRTWTCECGVIHERDPNASQNLRVEGLRILADGQSDSQNAHGVRVRPDMSGNER